MSWVTFSWALTIGACVTMALPHLLIGVRRGGWENLFFALAAISVAGVAWAELGIMHSRTPAEIGRALQWGPIPVSFLIIGVAGFTFFYFGTARKWLVLSAVATRLLALAVNFAMPVNLNFRTVTAVRPIQFLGETVSIPEGVFNPWTRLGELSSLLVLACVIDASVRLWRRGSPEDRRRAAAVGGSITSFLLLAAGLAALVHARVLRIPYLISLPFLGVILAMGLELSYDIFRAAHTALQLRASEHALRESEARMSLAASAANLGMWVWNIQRDELWMTAKGRVLLGLQESQAIDLELFLRAIHPDDRPPVEALIRTPSPRQVEYDCEYRVAVPDGETRWIAGFGRVEFDQEGRPEFMRGVVHDITQRKLAEEALLASELEVQRHRSELAHLSRVTMMGELSGSMAHELNQPLTAILSNAQAALRFLSNDETDLDEVRGILKDIVNEDKRAGEVIRRLRLLFKKGEVQFQPLDLNEVIEDVLKLLHSDLVNHNVVVDEVLARGLPQVLGDRVQLQQVLINLIINGCDAMADTSSDYRRLSVRSESANGDGLRVAVGDHGCGIAPDRLESVFEPFYTTKSKGMGLGLAVCKTIIKAHGGRLWAENNDVGGACFIFMLPTGTGRMS